MNKKFSMMLILFVVMFSVLAIIGGMKLLSEDVFAVSNIFDGISFG